MEVFVVVEYFCPGSVCYHTMYYRTNYTGYFNAYSGWGSCDVRVPYPQHSIQSTSDNHIPLRRVLERVHTFVNFEHIHLTSPVHIA